VRGRWQKKRFESAHRNDWRSKSRSFNVFRYSRWFLRFDFKDNRITSVPRYVSDWDTFSEHMSSPTAWSSVIERLEEFRCVRFHHHSVASTKIIVSVLRHSRRGFERIPNNIFISPSSL
jgi:hypothetical protein